MYTDLATVVPLVATQVAIVLSPQVRFLVELSFWSSLWMGGIVDGKCTCIHIISYEPDTLC